MRASEYFRTKLLEIFQRDPNVVLVNNRFDPFISELYLPQKRYYNNWNPKDAVKDATYNSDIDK